MRFKTLLTLAGFMFSVSIASATTLQPGSLDPSYGVNGVANPAVGTSSGGNAAVLQSDGKVVVGGSSTVDGKKHFTLARYTSDGKLDPSFGSNGVVILNASSKAAGKADGEDEINTMMLQGDKIIVGGYITNQAGDKDLALSRFTSSGALDNSFANGKAIYNLPNPGSSEEVSSIDFQSDGKIVAAIQMTPAKILIIGRFTSNGESDLQFGKEGKGFFSPEQPIQIKSIKVQTGQNTKDKILIGGTTFQFEVPVAFIARLLADGSGFDSKFTDTNTGARIFNAGQGNKSEIRSLVLQSDGKILMGVSANDDFALIRCNENCNEPNPEFIQTTDISNSSLDGLRSIALQSDGKIVAAGYTSINLGPPSYSLVRYNSDGSLDTTFGGSGKVLSSFKDKTAAEARSLLIQPDGKILAIGITADAQNSQFSIARYIDKPTDLSTIDNTGKGNGSNNGGGGGCEISSANPVSLTFIFLSLLPFSYLALRNRRLLAVRK